METATTTKKEMALELTMKDNSKRLIFLAAMRRTFSEEILMAGIDDREVASQKLVQAEVN